MNKKELDALVGADNSSSVTYTLRIATQNGRLSPDQRKQVARLVERAIGGLVTQFNLALPDRFDASMERMSSAQGTMEIDIGMVEG